MGRDIFPRFRMSNLGVALLFCTQNEEFRNEVADGFNKTMHQFDTEESKNGKSKKLE